MSENVQQNKNSVVLTRSSYLTVATEALLDPISNLVNLYSIVDLTRVLDTEQTRQDLSPFVKTPVDSLKLFPCIPPALGQSQRLKRGCASPDVHTQPCGMRLPLFAGYFLLRGGFHVHTKEVTGSASSSPPVSSLLGPVS